MNKKHDKTDIIKKGIELFRNKGYGNTGIQDILKACGIPKGSFYNFFSSKEAFALESIDFYSRGSLAYLLELDEDTSISSLEKIKRFFIITNDNLKQENCQLNCLLLSMTNEVSGENNPFSMSISSNIESMKSYINQWVIEGQKEGLLTQNYNANQITDFLYDSYHGAIIRMKYQQDQLALNHFEQFTLPLFYS